MPAEFVVHYSEVALKGNNRPEFVKALRRSINKSLSGIDHQTILADGRFMVATKGEGAQVAQRLSRVFGVSWVAPVSAVKPDYQEILATVLGSARSASGRSFKIDPRRSDKSFPLTSQELATKLGAEVVKATGKKVDLSNPDVAIHVDLIRGKALVYTDKVRGPGGLPIGTAGRVIHLFSGGIDSPVAAWLLMKRGCRPVYVHFYLGPSPLTALESKITKLIKVLSDYSGKITIVLLPFAEYQLATAGGPSDLEPSLFRRFMRMTAEALAPRFGASAIATGDSLSQAASQTLWNIASFDDGSSLPILRPLLTFDKEEIVALAKSIGTYELSLEEYKDCCAMITRHPRTKVRSDIISEHVRRFGLKELVWKAIGSATLVTYNPVGGVLKSSPLAEFAPRASAGRLTLPRPAE
ncbi:MAG TPA: tRNA uracil 4-sulfurtransferase ThiI [Nitrososphaerales archaeon]|nr:tRNA uracil 4-sulfurtransferase ThiI [Nitrososphaerales archaeon]